MATRQLLTRLASGIWVGAVAMGELGRRTTPNAADVEPLVDGPLVSIIIPARNEARDVGASVMSHLAQNYRNIEVIVVDDQSTDGTGAAAERAAGGEPRFHLLPGEPLPEGWVGKSWACHQGARFARGAWLLFSDADVIHHPEALGRALALAVDADRGGVTLAPRVDTGSVSERIVMPAAIQLIQTMVAPTPIARLRRAPLSMAAGAFVLVRRDVYDLAGGHVGIGHHMVDDLQLAAAIKRAGHLLVPADGTDLIHLRMYHGVRELWRGWRKNAAFAAPRGRTRGLVPAAGLALLGTLPWIALIGGLRGRQARRAGTGAVGVVAQIVLQRRAAPVVDTPARYGVSLVAGTLFIAAAAARGAIDRLTGRGPVWRGRRYPHAASGDPPPTSSADPAQR